MNKHFFLVLLVVVLFRHSNQGTGMCPSVGRGDLDQLGLD